MPRMRKSSGVYVRVLPNLIHDQNRLDNPASAVSVRVHYHTVLVDAVERVRPDTRRVWSRFTSTCWPDGLRNLACDCELVYPSPATPAPSSTIRARHNTDTSTSLRVISVGVSSNSRRCGASTRLHDPTTPESIGAATNSRSVHVCGFRWVIASVDNVEVVLDQRREQGAVCCHNGECLIDGRLTKGRKWAEATGEPLHEERRDDLTPTGGKPSELD